MNEGRDKPTNKIDTISDSNQKCSRTLLDHLFFDLILEIHFRCCRIGKRQISDLSDKSEPLSPPGPSWLCGLSLALLVILNTGNFITSVATIVTVHVSYYFIGKTSPTYAEAREKAETSFQGDGLRSPHPGLIWICVKPVIIKSLYSFYQVAQITYKSGLNLSTSFH